MSTWSSTCRQSVFKWHESNKHFSEFYPQDGGGKQLSQIWNEITSLSTYVRTRGCTKITADNETRQSADISLRCGTVPPYGGSVWIFASVLSISGHYVQTWRHPPNRKHITYCNAATGGPSHGHSRHAQKFANVRRVVPEICSRTDTNTHRKTHRHTRSSQYFAPLPGPSNNQSSSSLPCLCRASSVGS